jgi:hypothetical protein
MSRAAPIPVKASDPEGKILCIADLEREGSKKLSNAGRGNEREEVDTVSVR